jgi:hypothetical protein
MHVEVCEQIDSAPPRWRPKRRFCGAPLRHTFVDLGMSPLGESYVPAERLGTKVLSARNRAVAISPFAWPERASRSTSRSLFEKIRESPPLRKSAGTTLRPAAPDRRDERSFHLVLEHQRLGAGA